MLLEDAISLKGRSLITMGQLSKVEILHLLQIAAQCKKNPEPQLLQGKILASCFFEPSTRTRLSFEAAMLRLGGKTLGFSEISSTSMSKGESLHDTIKVIGSLADVVVLRHPKEGAASLASCATKTPIINAGDGANQHPSQTLVDLFTMQECQGALEGLKIALVGDLKYGRTVHSLVQACALFNMRFFFISPQELSLPEQIVQDLKKHQAKFSFHQSLEEVLGKVDILYMTRIQKERLDALVYKDVQGSYVLNLELLKLAQDHLKILHPLPRVGEIVPTVDVTKHAHYFQQAENGLCVRQALLRELLC